MIITIVVVSLIILFVIWFIGHIVQNSCPHEYKTVGSARYKYSTLLTGPLTGNLVLLKCEKCGEYNAYFATFEGNEPVNVDWAKGEFGIK
jgi:hypothetical protein